MMGRFKPNGSALDRSLGMLKHSKALTRYSFPHSQHAPLSAAVAPTRRCFGYTTESAHGPNSWKANLRANLSHGLTLPYNNTSARFMSSSATAKIQNLVDNNKVR
jgi:hypothetical protein